MSFNHKKTVKLKKKADQEQKQNSRDKNGTSPAASETALLPATMTCDNDTEQLSQTVASHVALERPNPICDLAYAPIFMLMAPPYTFANTSSTQHRARTAGCRMERKRRRKQRTFASSELPAAPKT
jgi:hypothetical protein